MLESAKRHLREGVDFYEDQSQGVGAYFLRYLRREIVSLKKLGGIHSQFLGYYCMKVPKFHTTVYYKRNAAEWVVYAVLDSRRSPRWIRNQLRSL